MPFTEIQVVPGPANYYCFPGALRELENFIPPQTWSRRSGSMVNGRLRRQSLSSGRLVSAFGRKALHT